MEKDILQQIYHKYSKKVYLYLYSLCHNHALAEDLMQETFIKALCAIDMSEEVVLPWLIRVARNLYLDYFRKERKHTLGEVDENQLWEECKVLEQCIQKEKNQHLYRAILKLPEMEKEAIILYWFSGLSQKEIGEILNLSHGNVRVILYRAKNKLREYLEKEELL